MYGGILGKAPLLYGCKGCTEKPALKENIGQLVNLELLRCLDMYGGILGKAPLLYRCKGCTEKPALKENIGQLVNL